MRVRGERDDEGESFVPENVVLLREVRTAQGTQYEPLALEEVPDEALPFVLRSMFWVQLNDVIRGGYAAQPGNSASLVCYTATTPERAAALMQSQG